MNPVDIITKKRNGLKLQRDEIEYMVKGFLGGSVKDYHMAAFLMAIYFQKLDFEETAILTEIMLQSGKKVDLSSVSGVKVGKHSTGGVGDKVSIILAPMVAACGVNVPMVSGRALGHTGGTLDKLESIPGFRGNLAVEEYRDVIRETGMVMVGQTDEIAPLDRKIYAMRDVTSTVESIPLIVASIMSKKLSEGIDSLVLDVKTGRGAFLPSEKDALVLAQMLNAIGNKFGLKSVAFITDMGQPLGYSVGNWIEVVECIECLRGKNVPDLMEVTYVLGGTMVYLGGRAKNIEDGISQCRHAIHSGKAWEKFSSLVKRQGGDLEYLNKPESYGSSTYSREVVSTTAGDVDDIDAREIGNISTMLGSGRINIEDRIDPRAGVVLRKKIGDSVEVGEPLALLLTEKRSDIEIASHRLQCAFRIATEPSVSTPLIYKMIDDRGVHLWHQCI